MKKLKFYIFACLFGLFIMPLTAQNKGIPFKMILSDQGNPLPNQNVTVRFNVVKDNNVVYTEDHQTTSDARGFIRLFIGEGTPVTGDFQTIDWSSGTFSIKTLISTGSGFNLYFQDSIYHVPYVKYALRGGTLTHLNDLEDVSTEGLANLFLGEGAGASINIQNANSNTYIGKDAANSQEDSDHNTVMGYKAFFSNTNGEENTAVGSNALYHSSSYTSNITIQGVENVAVGAHALDSIRGNYQEENVGIGAQIFPQARWSVLIGHETAKNMDPLSSSTIIGAQAAGDYATVSVGYKAAFGGRGSLYDVGIGSHSRLNGGRSVAVGYKSLADATVYSNSNVAIGYRALDDIINGYHNVGIGMYAYSSTNNNNSVGIGYNTLITGDDQTRLGNSSTSSIGGYANWTNFSDGRFKKDVKENVPGLDLVLKLRPLTYHLNMDALAKFLEIPDERRSKKSEAAKAAEVQIGFIAQEVEQAAEELGFDFHAVDKPQNDKDLYGLRYPEFVPVLVKATQELDELNRQNAAQQENNAAALEEIRRTVEKLQSQLEKLH